MSTRPLPRQAQATDRRPGLELAPGVSLALARVHEACGPARRSLALMLAGALAGGPGSAPRPGQDGGAVVWVQPAWLPYRLNGPAMAAFADPGRFLFLHPRRPEDLFWTIEEALRAACAPLVVADLSEPPALTPVRRLHLAAEAGADRGALRPLGLLLTPGDGGAQGVESRWHIAPDQAAGGNPAAWRLSRRRARNEPPADWRLTRQARGLTLAPLVAAA